MSAEQQVGHHRPLPADVDHAARLELQGILQALVRRLGDLHPARDAVRFHPARGVHGVAPDVVDELPEPDHAGDGRARLDPDSNLEVLAGRRPEALDLVEDVESHLGHTDRVVRAPSQAVGDHVRVADRLDLLELVSVGESVEDREDAVEDIDDFARA